MKRIIIALIGAILLFFGFFDVKFEEDKARNYSYIDVETQTWYRNMTKEEFDNLLVRLGVDVDEVDKINVKVIN